MQEGGAHTPHLHRRRADSMLRHLRNVFSSTCHHGSLAAALPQGGGSSAGLSVNGYGEAAPLFIRRRFGKEDRQQECGIAMLAESPTLLLNAHFFHAKTIYHILLYTVIQ